jgi:hypothetical protein
MTTYTNRYGDVFTFEFDEDKNVIWKGNFEHVRFGWPNDYKRAYEAYCKDVGSQCEHPMHIESFKEEVHASVYDENDRWVSRSEIGAKYGDLVDTADYINMVDPSGGPYLKEHMELRVVGMEDAEDRVIRRFESIKEGYKIITYGKYDHLADSETIGGLTI